MNKISDKIFIVRTIVLWSSELESLPDESRYLQALRGQCESLDAAALLETLDAIDTWRMYRNEVIHSLMNKRMESVQQKLSEQVEQGVQLARQLDAQVTILKRTTAFVRRHVCQYSNRSIHISGSIIQWQKLRRAPCTIRDSAPELFSLQSSAALFLSHPGIKSRKAPCNHLQSGYTCSIIKVE